MIQVLFNEEHGFLVVFIPFSDKFNSLQNYPEVSD
jgi:hypothetical protein